MSDPEKSYHFEIVCASMGKAQQIQKIMRCFALDAKIVSRKNTCGLSERRSSDRGCAECDGGTSITDGA